MNQVIGHVIRSGNSLHLTQFHKIDLEEGDLGFETFGDAKRGGVAHAASHLMPRGKQAAQEVLANVSGGTGEQDIHGVELTMITGLKMRREMGDNDSNKGWHILFDGSVVHAHIRCKDR